MRGATYDGTSWQSITPLQAGTTGGPSLISHNGSLLCLHRGFGDSAKIWCLEYDGLRWRDYQLPNNVKPYNSPYAPALAMFPRRRTTDDQWYFCNKCNGIFQNSFVSSGICPGSTTDGTAHAIGKTDGTIEKRYSLFFNSESAVGTRMWKHCVNCTGLYSETARNWCPISRNAGPHDGGGRFGEYFVLRYVDQFPGESNWRLCTKCAILFYAPGGNAAGHCPAGDSHSPQADEIYGIQYWSF